MKCDNCGIEYEDSLKTCHNCDGKEKFEANSLNPAADRVSVAITSGLFLTMCILMTVSCVLGFSAGIPVFNILFTIFMWLSYSQARKGMLDSTHLRSLSGTTFAMYVINYVLAGCIALTGFCLFIILSFIAQTPDMIEELRSSLDVGNSIMSNVIINIITTYGGLIGVAVIVTAVLMIVFNIMGFNKIHKLAKSVYQSIHMNVIGFQNVKAAKVWLYIIGAFEIVSALSNRGSVLIISSLCSALTTIFAGVLVGKYIEEKD